MKFRWILLAILQGGRRTGYEVKKVVDRDMEGLWHVKGPQVYAELKGMEKMGWVVSEKGPSIRGPERQYFSLTETGRQAFSEELHELSGRLEVRDEWKALWWVMGQLGDEAGPAQRQFLMDLIAARESDMASLSRDRGNPDDVWINCLNEWRREEAQLQLKMARRALQHLSQPGQASARQKSDTFESAMETEAETENQSVQADADNIFEDLRGTTLL